MQYISLVARVKGYISEEQAKKAINKIRQQHTLVGIRIYEDSNSNPWFTTESVPENPLKVVQRESETDWYQELLKEYKIRFELKKGPLVRFVLVHSSEISELIVVCHHVVCDGMSLAILARDLLLYIGTPDREVQKMSVAPLATSDNFPGDIKIGKIINLAINKMNKIWLRQKQIFDDEDESNIFKAFWDNYDFKIISVELSEKETSYIINQCNTHGVTVNSALNTAFITARNAVLGPFKGGKRKVMIPVSTRKRFKNPVDEHFGLYVSGFEFKPNFNPKKGFWKNAKNFNEKAKENLYINKIFKFAAITGFIDQTLVDAREFSFLGNLVPSNYSRYKKIHAFSSDEKNIVNKRTQKQIPNLPGLAITNLGKLDYPVNFGPLELERFIFMTSGSQHIELVIAAVTVAGKLTFTINYLEQVIDTPSMEKIKDAALKYLGLVK